MKYCVLSRYTGPVRSATAGDGGDGTENVGTSTETGKETGTEPIASPSKRSSRASDGFKETKTPEQCVFIVVSNPG